MSADGIVALATSGLAFLASIIAVIVSAYNARFARFASEKWWERKAEAYTRIIGALSDLVYYYGRVYDAEIQGRDLPEERRHEIGEHWKKGYLEVRKATDIGAFMISREAEEALKEYWKRPKGTLPEDWFAGLETDYMSAEKCLKKLVACAKKDLRV
jgi:hypothetical protein